jgi:hypothetical protein
VNIKIENDDQLFNTKFWRRKFQESVDQLRNEGAPIDIEPELVSLHIRSMESVIQEMDEEIERYEREASDRASPAV